MALFNWDNSFSVGINVIDHQHQKLIAMINDLNDAMRQGKGKEVTGQIIKGLVNYTITHFGLEERYFVKFGYPDAEDHIRKHKAFVQKVTEFQDGFENGKLGLNIELMNFLKGWLTKHIKGTDKKYIDFFHENGLK